MKPYISYLRVFAAFAVVMLHTCGSFVGRFEKYPFDIWNASNFLESFTRFCVPIFLMVSGVLLLNKDEELFDFLKKRYKRVLLPFLFWACFYIAGNLQAPFLSVSNIKTIIISFLKPVSFHFWYVYLILGLYLFIPILRKWAVLKNRKETIFFLSVWGFTTLINNKTKHFLPEIDLSYFTGSIGFLVLGHYLSNMYIFKNKKFWKWTGFAGFMLMSLVIFYLTQRYTLKYHRFFSYFYDGFFSALQALFFYIWISNVGWKSNKLVTAIDSSSYGIYLIHILILGFVARWAAEFGPTNSLQQTIYLISVGGLTFSISFLIIFVLKKIPVLKSIVA